jgi:hypothetical protein
MKVPENFEFDKRVVEKLIRKNPSHKERVKEYLYRLSDSKENVELINFAGLYPQGKYKEDKKS